MRVLLETMLFSIGPALIDVIGAAVYLSAKQAWMALIVCTSVAFYVPVTVVITEHRGKLRRELNSLDNRKSAKVRARS
jgi:ATP-binding cassette, subfamily B (MDR/TAP), member 6